MNITISSAALQVLTTCTMCPSPQSITELRDILASEFPGYHVDKEITPPGIRSNPFDASNLQGSFGIDSCATTNDEYAPSRRDITIEFSHYAEDDIHPNLPPMEVRYEGGGYLYDWCSTDVLTFREAYITIASLLRNHQCLLDSLAIEDRQKTAS